MIDEQGREFRDDEGEVIDLTEVSKLFIAKAVDPKEISEKTSQ